MKDAINYKHQIVGLRTWVPKTGKNAGKIKTHDKKFADRGWGFNSIDELFLNPRRILDLIPHSDRWNMFYTIARCDEVKRNGLVLDAIFFDLDGADLLKWKEYLEILAQNLDLDPKAIGVICSGNGIHFVIMLKNVITKIDYIHANKHHYKAIISSLNLKLKKSLLIGCFDPSIWDKSRILRLPGTVNKKPHKEDSYCDFIKQTISAVNLDIATVSGIPDVKLSSQIPSKHAVKFPLKDSETLLGDGGCNFMRFAKDNQDKLSEPQWYAMLSIVARCKNAEELAQQMSQNHPDYCPDETELKLSQASCASGPRTCENIAQLWDGCYQCSHYGSVKSPVLIVGKEEIPTEHTGFHKIVYQNKDIKYIPCYTDLRQFFEKQHKYIGLDGSRNVLVFADTHYEPLPRAYIKQFAQDHFNPPADNKKASEFSQLIERTNLRKMSWFDEGTAGKINFQNGVFDLNRGELLEHSPDFGFRYVLPYEYDPDATAPTFIKYLEDVTCGDGELQKILLEYLGYILSGDQYWLHKALILIGDGANGKSTFINVIKKLTGEKNYACICLGQFSHEYNRQLIDGKLLNVSEELPSRSLSESAYFKILTGGGEVAARAPYQSPYSFKNKAKMVFSCNEIPVTHDMSYGLLRRMLLVPFNQTFDEGTDRCDPFIETKLEAELAGVFNLALGAYTDVKVNRHFTKSQKAKKLLTSYQRDINSAERWLSDHVSVLPIDTEDHGISTNELYISYKIDMEAEGEKPYTMQRFSKFLAKWLPDSVQRKTMLANPRDGKVRGYRGLKVVCKPNSLDF